MYYIQTDWEKERYFIRYGKRKIFIFYSTEATHTPAIGVLLEGKMSVKDIHWLL